MLYKNEEAFAKAVKGRAPGGLTLLYGQEPYLIESWAKKLARPFAEGSSFNFQKLDGRKLDCDQLLDAVETLPLMAQEKCVLLDDLHLKPLSPGDLDKLLDILGDLPPSCILIITGKPGVFDPKSAAGKKLIKLCGEAGDAAELGPRAAGGLTRFLQSAAKRRGCELPADLARYLLQTCETDMASLEQEMDKLCAYAGGGILTREQADAVIIPRTEAKVFDLGKAILAGNVQRAMELLRDLFYLREQPVMILSVLTMSYADLYRARAARSEGRTPAEVIDAFGYRGREFRVRNAFQSRLSADTLRSSLEVLLDCDRRIKTTGTDPRILLEQAVIRLFALGA